MDIGLGIIIAFFTAHLLGQDITSYWILTSIVFAVLPDIDTPIELIQRGKLGGKASGFHRTITHYPVLYLPFVALLILLNQTPLALLLALNIMTHFLHDSFYTGWGIKWGWPIYMKYIKLFASQEGDKMFDLETPFARWTDFEQKAKQKKYGFDDWFKRYYMRPSTWLVFETSFFIAGLTLLVRWAFYG